MFRSVPDAVDIIFSDLPAKPHQPRYYIIAKVCGQDKILRKNSWALLYGRNDLRRLFVCGQSKGGRWVLKWSPTHRFIDFAVAAFEKSPYKKMKLYWAQRHF